jgi:hypothetical protein
MDKIIFLWTIDNSQIKMVNKLIGSQNPVYTIMDLKDGSNIITGDEKGEIIVRDITKVHHYIPLKPLKPPKPPKPPYSV